MTAETGGPTTGRARDVHALVGTRPRQVADVVAGLSWSVTGVEELLEYLQQCVDVAVRVVADADHAGVTVSVSGDAFTANHTDEVTLEVDRRQYEAGDGPCLEAARTGELVRVDVATSEQRWPEFTEDAVAIGVRSFLAAPLGPDGHRVGALNLYSRRADGFDADDVGLLSLVSGFASRTLADYLRLVEDHELAEQLREAMRTRAPIEQAKGILRATRHLGDAEAFAVLRKTSQDTNVKLAQVAVDFVESVSAAPADAQAQPVD